ncbi:protein kinase [Streptomyces sp. NPDC059783]|uniref:protein kinase n=1 Tax=Streptomyces sp. NPDC059783 TaxID=3346944 RepID=UPI003651D736
MDDYAGRVLADRYRLPLPPSDEYELVETRAFDTYSGQEVLVRQVPLPEVVDAEVLDADGQPTAARRTSGRTVRRSSDPAVRRAIEAAQAAAQVPDHPRLDQVFDVFAEAGSLWIVSELVAARPLAALLAERPLNPFRAAEIGSDVLAALHVLHAHGWTHRNITVRTVLVCDDGRVVLTGLAAGAAEEALCGYVPMPRDDDGEGLYGPPGIESGPTGPYVPPGLEPGSTGPTSPYGPPAPGALEAGPDSYARPEALEGGHDTYGGPGALEAGPDAHARPGALEGGSDSYASSGAGESGRDPYAGPGSSEGGAGSYGPSGADESGLDAYARPWAPEGGSDFYAPSEAGESGLDAYARPGAPEGEPGSYAPSGGVPAGDDADSGPQRPAGALEGGADAGSRPPGVPEGGAESGVPGARGAAAIESGTSGSAPVRPYGAGALEAVPPPAPAAPPVPPAGLPVPPAGADNAAQTRAARAGAIAAYRAGARAAARLTEEERRAAADGTSDTGTLPVQRPARPAAPPAGPAAPPTGPPVPLGGTAAPGAFDEDPYDDEDEDDDYDEGPGPVPPRRLHLTGTWNDGPGQGRPVPAGGSGEDALRADSRRETAPAVRPRQPVAARKDSPGRWDEIVAGSRSTTPAYRGPATTLAAERARQARIAVVGAVTERWAPEQAGPVHENWQLAPPIGPATDLWALGALLYRAVQGHAPYPEDNAAELVQMVCGEPPAFAEECGPLRPVVESLLRQDPTERPDFEELRGWLRSLVRSAPEPEAGADVVPLPSADAAKLPIVRRRGELVRKRRSRKGGGAHARHRQTRERPEPPPKAPRAPRGPKEPKVLRTPPPGQGGGRAPRRLGRLLLVLILLALAGAIAYAMLFMPKAGTDDGNGPDPSRTATGAPAPDPGGSGDPQSSGTAGAQQPQTSRSAVALPSGYTLRKDAEGFEIGLPKSWKRVPPTADRRITYGDGGFRAVIVPGRDTAASGADPLDYQRDTEPELSPYRDSGSATSSGLRRIDVGQQAMAEGRFTWKESGREVVVRNLVMIVEGRYHVLQVIGPVGEQDEVDAIYQQASVSYRVTG